MQNSIPHSEHKISKATEDRLPLLILKTLAGLSFLTGLVWLIWELVRAHSG